MKEYAGCILKMLLAGRSDPNSAGWACQVMLYTLKNRCFQEPAVVVPRLASFGAGHLVDKI